MASHCLVRWEDGLDQYAVVDLRRSKSVSTLKVGVTTCFEGFQRERRRGTVLFLGSKKDCTVYGLDIVGDDDGQVNLSQWSCPPGLREQAEGLSQIIRQNTTSFKRTVSNMSSSSASKEKTTEQPPPPLASSITVCDSFDSPAKCIKQKEQSTSNHAQGATSSTVTDQSVNVTTASSAGNDSSQEEVKVLREKLSHLENVQKENENLKEKVLSMEDELSYLRNTSIPLPDEKSYSYMKTVTNTYERRKADANPKMAEMEKELPCTAMELQRVKLNTNSSKAINDLIKFCYKDVNLKEECFSKLKARNPILMKNIYDYVQYIYAPKIITKTEFSNAVSLRCRHLRQEQ